MTREEHKQIIQDLLKTVAPEHQATATSLMTQLSEDYEETLTELETTNKNNETLTNNNEKLREVNADLFLKVGVTKKDTQNVNQNEKPTNEDNENYLSFDDLFNEKGDLI